MKHTIDHDLDTATARKVADRAFSEYKARFPDYEPTAHWVSDTRADISFNAKGIRLKGAMEISEKAIAMDLDVPFLLRPFQKKAIEVIDREVRLWLGKAREGKL
jgi:Putative polyhydroxyalkanoic acid system protein (PHA_gran_rgn)